MKIIKALLTLIIMGNAFNAFSIQFDTVAPTNYVSVHPPTNAQPIAILDPSYALFAGSISDPSVRASAVKSFAAFYDYNAHSYEFNEKTFEWQYFSTKIIFWTVLIIVFTGILFSGLQFYMAFFLKNHSGKKKNSENPESEEIEFEGAGVTRIRIRSQYVGVVILAMSIVFFYLYLNFVYPITAIGNKPPQQNPTTAIMQTPK